MKESKWFSDALLINRDPCTYFAAGWDYTSRESAKKSIREFFQKFTGYSITDMQICVFENTSLVPSKSVMWRGLKGVQAEENGIAVSYPREKNIYTLYEEFGVDPVEIFIETMKNAGIRPWLTLRMNDAHFSGESTSFLRDDFFYTAKKNGWVIGEEKYGNYGNCLDYANENVRNRMTNFIAELLEKYDVFGIELDFMREIYCFDYKSNEKKHEIMNSFMKSVREICTAAEEKIGHPLHIMIRLPRSIEDAYSFGFDVEYFAKNKLVDAVVPTPRWRVSDDAIPVAAWKALVGENIAVFPGIETLHLNFTNTPVEISKAYAAAWYAQGADGIYFNNHDYATEEHSKIYTLHKDTANLGARRYVVTYQDIFASGNPRYRPLPMEVQEKAALDMNICPIRAGEAVKVIIEFEGENAPEISLDGVACKSFYESGQIFGKKLDEINGINEKIALTGEKTLVYNVTDYVTSGKLSLEITGEGILKYLELCVE